MAWLALSRRRCATSRSTPQPLKKQQHTLDQADPWRIQSNQTGTKHGKLDNYLVWSSLNHDMETRRHLTSTRVSRREEYGAVYLFGFKQHFSLRSPTALSIILWSFEDTCKSGYSQASSIHAQAIKTQKNPFHLAKFPQTTPNSKFFFLNVEGFLFYFFYFEHYISSVVSKL